MKGEQHLRFGMKKEREKEWGHGSNLEKKRALLGDAVARAAGLNCNHH